MAIRIEGASARNDDVLAGHAAPDLQGNQQGYTKPGSGLESWDVDVDRARRLGAESHGRLAPQVNQTDTGESRGLQMGALGMLRAQAEGSAPSSSAIMAQRANQNAIGVAGHQVTAARSPGGAIAAQRMASDAAGNSMLAGNAANANQRLSELSHGAGAYASGAGQVQNQDVQTAAVDADLEAQQRAANEARQQGYERRGWNTRNQESQTHDRWQALNEGDVRRMGQERDAQNAADAAQNQEYIGTGSAVATGGISGYVGSDPRMKMHIGSLGGLMRRGGH